MLAEQPHDHAPIDLGVIADNVLRSLATDVPRSRVDRLLTELLEQEFSTARVTTFLPVFLHRLACETLRREDRHEAERS
jgi:hypothetical protein